MMQAPTDSVVESRLRAEAHSTALWRVVAVVAGWLVARLLATSLLPSHATVGVKIVLGAALSGAAWWALTPGQRNGGPEFMRSDHWTKFLGIPLVLGFALAVLGLWHLLRSGN